MRCPKCGYISFDDRASCAKCSSSLEELVDELHGTGIHADPPSFLTTFLEKEEQQEVAETLDLEEVDTEAGEEADASLAGPEEEEGIAIDLEAEEGEPAAAEETAGEIAFSIEEEEPAPAASGEEEEEGIAFSLEEEGEEEASGPPAPEARSFPDGTGEPPEEEPDVAVGDEPSREAVPVAEEPLPDIDLDLDLEASEPDTEAASLPGEDLDTLVDAAQEVEDHAPGTPEDREEEPLPELALDLPETEEGAQGTPGSRDADAPVLGEPAPLRDTSDLTAGLEEIDLADLVDSTAPEDAAIHDEEGEIDIDALEEELFDLADVLDEEEEPA